MTRGAVLAALTLAASLAAAGCASNANYSLQNGDANYDAIRKATEECKAHGGEIHLKSGGDTTELNDYQCKMGKGK